MGLGGGFLMTIYDAKTGKTEFLDARETAPKSAHKDMFGGNESLAFSGKILYLHVSDRFFLNSSSRSKSGSKYSSS